jgi:hypothetical protein
MSGETPRLFGIEPPRPRLEAVRIVDIIRNYLPTDPIRPSGA